jgi:hypothetical protein
MVTMENVFMVHLPVVLMLVFTIQLDPLKVCWNIFMEKIIDSFLFTGWRPSEFKSSRGERAEKRSYEPEDFMDKGVRIINRLA